MSATSPNQLEQALIRRIRLAGPLTVADFMVEALSHPVHGYYRKAEAIGRAGDFITSPEISQVFGELIGAWLAERWIALGRPAFVRLVELGPGRGTLLADALRATRGVTGFHDALVVDLVEINPVLRAYQAAALERWMPSDRIGWHDRFADLPDGMMLLVANEFFDALPVRQLQMTPMGWSERMVGIDESGERLRLAPAPGPSPLAMLLPDELRSAASAPGTLVEVSPQRALLAESIARRILDRGGAALVIDYGSHHAMAGPTLQAVRKHRKVDVLEEPGDADLSAHVDFGALARAAHAGGAVTYGPVSQRLFLRNLGIEARRQALAQHAEPARGQAIAAGIDRLIDPLGMGTLFLALAIGQPGTPPPAGFET